METTSAFLRAHKLTSLSKFKSGDIRPFEGFALPKQTMLLVDKKINKDSPLLVETNKVSGLITLDLIGPKAKYFKHVVRVPALTDQRNKVAGYKYEVTEGKLLSHPSTTVLVRDLSYVNMLNVPTIQVGNKVEAAFDLARTMMSYSEEPYNMSGRMAVVVIDIPKVLPTSIDKLVKLIDGTSKYIEQNTRDITIVPLLNLFRIIFGKQKMNKFFMRGTTKIMLRGDSKYMFYDMGDLFSISKAFPDIKSSKLGKLTDNAILRAFMTNAIQLKDIPIDPEDEGELDKILSEFEAAEEDGGVDVVDISLSKGEIKKVDSTLIKVDTDDAIDDIESLGIKVADSNRIHLIDDIRELKPKTTFNGKDIPASHLASKEMRVDYIREFDKINIKNYHHNIRRAIMSLSLSGYNVDIVNEEVTKNIAEDYTTYTLSIKPPMGPTRTQKLIVPNLNDEGTFKQKGNSLAIRKQKVDNPIRKIKKDEVALTTYYGKMFFKRGGYAYANQSKAIHNQLKSKYTMVIAGSFLAYETKLPYIYELIGRATQSFVKDDILFSLDYQSRDSGEVEQLLNKFKKTISVVEGSKYVVVGSSSKYIYLVGFDNNLYAYNGKGYDLLGDFKDYLEIDKLPTEYIETKVLGERVPLVLLLLKKYTLNELFYILNVKPRKITSMRQVEDEWTLRFRGTIYAFKNDNIEAMLILGGLTKFKFLKDIPISEFSSKLVLDDILHKAGYQSRLSREMINLHSLFIDPTARDVLEAFKMPTTFRGLLFKTAELLKDDYVADVNQIDGYILKGHERISGLIYNILAKDIASNLHSLGIRKSNLGVSPYALVTALSSDATIMNEEDINPISTLKHTENVTILGQFARSKDSVDMKAREFHTSAVGIESEATKESGNVGMDFYLSAVPLLHDALGIMHEVKEEDLKYAHVFSTSAMMSPFANAEDGKRTLFISVQNAHVTASVIQEVLPLLTGYEYVLPHRVSKRYTMHAKEAGKVTALKGRVITIKYKSGEETYKFNDWFSKEAGGKTYIHRMKTNLKVGDKLEEGYTIYYDEGFFGIDMFNPKRVVYKSGALAYTMITEGEAVYEDSCSISSTFANRLKVDSVYVKQVNLPINTNIIEYLSVGDKVTYDTALMTFGETTESELGNMSEKTKELLRSMDFTSPKAETYGEVLSMEVYYNYNGELIASDSVDKLVKKIDKLMVDNHGFKGSVDTTFSIQGRPVVDGTMVVKFFIGKKIKHELGSKIIFSNQLKATVGIMHSDNMRTQEGRHIDATFGLTSVGARIVPSFEQIISLNTILVKARDNVVAIWDE